MTSNKANNIIIQFSPKIIKMLGKRSSLEQKCLWQWEWQPPKGSQYLLPEFLIKCSVAIWQLTQISDYLNSMTQSYKSRSWSSWKLIKNGQLKQPALSLWGDKPGSRLGCALGTVRWGERNPPMGTFHSGGLKWILKPLYLKAFTYTS